MSERALEPQHGLATGEGASEAKGFLTALFCKAVVPSADHDVIAVLGLDLPGIDRPDAILAEQLAYDR